VVLTLLVRRFFRQSREAGQAQTTAGKNLSSRLVDVLQGIKPIKAMGREGLVWPLLEHETEALNLAKRSEVSAAETVKAFQEPTLTLFLAVGLFLVLEVAGQPLTSTVLMAFIFYRLVAHINTLQMRYQLVLAGESAFFSFQDEWEAASAQREGSGGPRAFQAISEGIRLENLSFGYDQTPVLDGVNAFIPAGSFVAVHGESGSGKTTLADLIVGLHRPDQGRILVDGTPLEEFDLTTWRRAIGYVPQEMLLFTESIFLNVTLGDPSFSHADAEEALRLAGAWEFVKEKPGGLDHPMGHSGALLSGGQRQRIALARALVGKPSLLILDEVTTALDPATELEICDTLQGLPGGVTILSISHQTAMREAADLVFTMRNGRLETLENPVTATAS
jgi:ATP-binding cassette subfamily C protein